MKKKIFLLLTLIFASNSSFANINKSFLSLGIAQNDFSSKPSAVAAVGSLTGTTTTPTLHTGSSDNISSQNLSPSFSVFKNLSLNNLSVIGLRLSAPQYKKIFLNYEAFYDHLNNSQNVSSTVVLNSNTINLPTNLNFKSRYGAKIGIGYAFNDGFSIYTNYGFSSLDYEIDNRSNSQALTPGNTLGTSTNDRTLDSIISFGVIYNIYNIFNLGFEYSVQNSELQSSDYVILGTPAGINEFKFDSKIESYTFKLSKEF